MELWPRERAWGRRRFLSGNHRPGIACIAWRTGGEAREGIGRCAGAGTALPVCRRPELAAIGFAVAWNYSGWTGKGPSQPARRGHVARYSGSSCSQRQKSFSGVNGAPRDPTPRFSCSFGRQLRVNAMLTDAGPRATVARVDRARRLYAVDL